MSIKQLFLQEKHLPRIDLISIISHVIGAPKERVLMDQERVLTAPEYNRVKALVERRRNNEPLSYLTNQKEFFSETFYVDERVLIPRPETELLVEAAIEYTEQHDQPVHVLDMGTGSGAIGITLAKHGAERVTCIDTSIEALAVAKENAKSIGPRLPISFLCADLFDCLDEKPIFDVICANLPYIAEEDWANLMADVRDFEPKAALVGGASGNEIYERFVPRLPAHLKSGGVVLCEIDGPNQADAISGMIKKAGLSVYIMNDLFGRERVVRGEWTSL